MRLVIRRARAATGLPVAGASAALIATLLLTGLAGYSQEVVDAGGRSAVRAAPPAERSLLVTGSAGGSGAQAQSRDAGVHAKFARGFGGRPVRISGAGYALGRHLTGNVGSARPDSGGIVFASTVYLDDLANHAELVSGAWARPGAARTEVTLAEAAAGTLGAKAGTRLSLADRRTGRATQVVVRGIWRPRDAAEAYWQLVPWVSEGVAPGTTTYGPIVLHRDDFLRGYANGASLAWVVEPDLAGVGLADLAPLRRELPRLADALPEQIGLGDSGQVTTRLDQLVDRLARADLVGRSALVTPMLLIAVIGGYALMLVALLLNEHRRAETALMRARGAGRGQLAGLAAREAALVVLPAALIAPVLAPWLLGYADRTPLLAAADVRLDAVQPGPAWAIGIAAAAGCLLAMVGPAVRRSGTYLEELTSRSRPGRWAVAQRTGVDLALVAFAVLAWFQLRQYSSPLAGIGGTIGVDPLLAAAPTLGVLAGAVVALRLLPPATRFAERFVDRRTWTATMLGMWQAGRRPHAGPVLLLALAVAVSTLAWCLASTAERSLHDQADHGVGADLRFTDAGGVPPHQRERQISGLPAVTAVMPVWRDNLRLGPEQVPTDLVAVDPTVAPRVVRYRPDLVDGGSDEAFRRMADGRKGAPPVRLHTGVRRLTGELGVSAGTSVATPVETYAVIGDAHGRSLRLKLGTARAGRTPVRFAVDVPLLGDVPLWLIRFDVVATSAPSFHYDWQLRSLTTVDAAGRAEPVELSSVEWRMAAESSPSNGRSAVAGRGSLAAGYDRPADANFLVGAPLQFSVSPPLSIGPVPVVATPAALRALRTAVGGTTRLNVGGAQIDARIVDEVLAVPGTSGTPAAVLADLPALAAALYAAGTQLSPVREWWATTDPEHHGAAAAAAGALDGVEVRDRLATAASAGRDPYGLGGRAGLFAAALGATLLALVGMAVDARATARQRVGELAVLHTLGAGSRLLARALIAEQTFLAGLGVVVGLAVGVGVAASMAPLVILTPAADRPVPVPLLDIAWTPMTATAIGLLAAALGMSALIALTMRQRLAAAQLRIGADQ